MAIGTAGAILGSAAIGAIGSSRAASAQSDAAKAQQATQRYIFDQQTELTAPWRGAGENALAALQYEFGLGPRPTFGSNLEIEERTRSIPGTSYRAPPVAGLGGLSEREQNMGLAAYQNSGPPQTETYYMVGDRQFDTRGAAQQYIDSQGTPYAGFKATPSYDFRRQQGLDAIDASAASRGNLFSGATLQRAQTFGDELASREYQNYLAGLAGVAGYGQTGLGQQMQAGQNYATGMSNALAAQGNAASAGAIGMTNALQGGLNNWIGYQTLQGFMPKEG